jgi:DNA-binding transcriptional ArsR family regulator
MRNLLAITKALADPNRIRILCALAERDELCVCQVQELLELAPSSTSKHLSILAAAGLLNLRKDRRWVYYSLASRGQMPQQCESVVDWLTRQAAGVETIHQDRLRLKEILSLSPEELCQQQAKGQRCCFSAPATPVGVKSRKGMPGR